jgi:VCBS repeat-containing protein
MRIKIVLAALSVATSLSASSEAFAWGCVAISENGTYGYSYNYDNEAAATQRALNECATRATTDQTCTIESCDEGS